MFLSQPPIATMPSKRWALPTSSIESAITSRLGNENFIPSVPIEIPSLTVMVPKICGAPPPTRTPSFTFSAKRLICTLHGVISLHVLATPISGLLKSSSVKPTARSIERFGARTSPSVIILLRRLYTVRIEDPFVSGIMAKLPFFLNRAVYSFSMCSLPTLAIFAHQFIVGMWLEYYTRVGTYIQFFSLDVLCSDCV